MIVAAGAGARAGAGDAKQWRTLVGKPVVRWSAEALLAAGADELVVVVADGQQNRAQAAQGRDVRPVSSRPATRPPRHDPPPRLGQPPPCGRKISEA